MFQLADLLREFDLDDDVLRTLMSIYQKELKLGLSSKTAKRSSLKCLITYVQDLPSGNENGRFLAIDVAGLVFRVVLIILAKNRFELRAKLFTVPPDLLSAKGDEFFDFLVECLFRFTFDNKVNNEGLPLGLTFGWPVEQRGLRVGILTHWTKGFNCSGVVGNNLVQLLEQAIDRRKDLSVHVAAVLNDTTGTLMSCAWKNRDCKIGLIIAGGTNCCYVETVKRAKKFEDGDPSKPYIIINTESGAFGDGGQIDFIRTTWDKELDADTINPGFNTFEKMISALYLGELVRRVLVSAAERGIIFNGRVTERLAMGGSFDTKFLLDIARDLPGQYRTARAVFNDMGYPMPWAQDCTDLQYVCYVMWQRSARILSAQMAALLDYMGFQQVTIGVDGILYRTHTGYSELMKKKIRELADPSINFRVELTEDGGGLGAALIAATTTAAAAAGGAAAPATSQKRHSGGQKRKKVS